MDLNPNDSFHGVLKTMMQNVVNNMGLPEIVIGTVETIGPLSIRINPELLLLAEDLILTETVCYKQVDLTHTNPPAGVGLASGATVVTAAGSNPPQGANIMINRDLIEGDKVVMITVMGGQQYVVLSKVVNE